MKKIIALVTILIFMLVLMSGCNKQMVDFNYKFDKAYISLPNGQCIEGKIDSWTDFEDGDQIQLKIDGKTYLTHISNVVMVNE